MIGIQVKANGWKPASELLFSHQLPALEWAHGTGKELLQEYLEGVPKLYRCGDLGALNGLAAGKVAEAEDIAALGNARLKGSKQNAQAETLPAIGAALHGVREASLAANFLRHEGADRDGYKTLSLLNTVLMGLLVLALIAWGVSFPVKDELRLRQLQKENQKLEPSVQALRREDSQLQLLRKEASYLSDLDLRRGEVLRLLDELSKVVPNNVYFSNLRYRAGVLEVQGNAENASALIPLLERSPLFENVTFNAPSNRGRDNRETFSLKADLEKPKVNAPEVTKLKPTQPTKDKAKP
jgi:Tfp pilus assembly protein PilN